MNTLAKNLIYELWFSYAERLLEQVIQITELTQEQAEALRRVALRPNDFIVRVEGEPEEELDETED